jgi:UMF1 family MFS transporter
VTVEPESPPVPRRRILAWCAFDFANSSYTTLITTVAFSVYFSYAVVGANHPHADLLWSGAGILVNVVLIATSPVFGALADFSGRKKRWLLATVVQTVVATALLALVGPGDVVLAVVLYVVATIGFEGGYVFYNAFLPEVSTPKTIGRVSGLAWGMGFLGGLAALVVCIPFLAKPLADAAGRLDPAAVAGYRTSFLIVAAFFALFSVPTFLFLPERAPAAPLGRVSEYVAVGFQRVGDTLRHLKSYPETAKFVLAYLCFFGGINTVIRFSSIYASKTFGIEGVALLALFVFTNIVAIPGTLVAGRLADRIGGRRTLVLTLLLWGAVAIAGAFARTQVTFWIMAAGAAIGMGSAQAVGRSFMARISPSSRESEFFGFYTLAGPMGSIVAFLTFGLVSSGSGNQRLAVLWTLPFFVAGMLLTLWIEEDKAIRDAEGVRS